ncbi:hypothetical protein GMDG_01254, partial [Pseudogymnoascus destructans 20631-21]
VQKSWATLVAGGAGGIAAAIFTAPLDVLKTRLQSDYYKTQLAQSRAACGSPSPDSLPILRSSTLHLRETLNILFSIRRYEGWPGLFKGLGPNLVGVVPASAVKFYTYGSSKQMLSRLNGDREAVWIHMVAAACSGIATSTITNPIWLVKTRLQLDKLAAEGAGCVPHQRYRNSIDCVMQIMRHEGVKGFYRGLTASYLGVAESTLHWVLYEQAKILIRLREERLVMKGETSDCDGLVKWVYQASAAGGTKLFAAIAAYPHEVVRTRLRAAPTHNGLQKYTGLYQCFCLVWKEEGLAALYGGLTAHVLRVVPATAIVFGVYEITIGLINGT